MADFSIQLTEQVRETKLARSRGPSRTLNKAAPVTVKRRESPRIAKVQQEKTIQVPPFLDENDRLFLNLFWGDRLQEARSFPTSAVLAESSDQAQMPLWGFAIPDDGFLLARPSSSGGFRLFVPPKAKVEIWRDFRFHAANDGDVCFDGAGASIKLEGGDHIRFRYRNMSLIAYVQKAEPLPAEDPKEVPWVAVYSILLAAAALVMLILFTPSDPLPFRRNDRALLVHLRMDRKPPPKIKENERVKDPANRKELAEKKPQKHESPAKHRRPLPSNGTPTANKVLAQLNKLTAGGPTSQDLLTAVDKIGNGSASRKVASLQLAGLIGKEPSPSGIGAFGMGGGRRGGAGGFGAEVLRGNVGELGDRGYGREADVGGRVTQAVARNLGVQGAIDRDGVLRVVNAHLQEIRTCYERSLVAQPSLSGKVVLEWAISTTGQVVSVRTKSSSLTNNAVESCILASLKTWQFPQARGGNVFVSYPFLFNSVGF